MCISVLVFAALIAPFQAQDTGLLKNCPTVDLVKNFDLDTYAQGAWYEIARYSNGIEKYGTCVTTTYKKVGDNDFIIEVEEVENGTRLVYDGLLNLSASDHLSGILSYVFRDGQTSTKIVITFLAVDYNSYAIKYSCTYDANAKKRVELAWILSRTKELSPSAKADIDKYLSSSKLLDKQKFFWDSFTEDACKYTKSNIDRRLPKRYTS